jgi:DNA-binding NtrC family response regulator
MNKYKKKILIVDETGFARICSAILEKEGYGINAVADVHQCDSLIDFNNIGLVITSYPYGAFLLEKLKEMSIPVIVLSDHMSGDLISKLDHFDKSISHCMIKPLDYHKFRILVNNTMMKELPERVQ